jgi:hypothetical protein
MSLEPDRFYTTVEVAEILSCATVTLEQWRARDMGPPYVKLAPKCVRYRGADLATWLAAHTVATKVK